MAVNVLNILGRNENLSVGTLWWQVQNFLHPLAHTHLVCFPHVCYPLYHTVLHAKWLRERMSYVLSRLENDLFAYSFAEIPYVYVTQMSSLCFLLFWLLYYRLWDGSSPHSINYTKHLNLSDLISYDQILNRKRSKYFHSSLWCPTDDVTTRPNIPTWRCCSHRPYTSVILYCSNGKKSQWWSGAVREEMLTVVDTHLLQPYTLLVNVSVWLNRITTATV
jgi:hypothetical protein